MNAPSVLLVATVTAVTLFVVGCGQAPPAPTPTKPPAVPTRVAEPTKPVAAPTKAADPTKAPAAQPTAAPAEKVDFPTKGKSIKFIVPSTAGGSTDIAARVLAASMEKEVGIPIEVVNKPGAGNQIGVTEMVTSKPDGYTLGYTPIPTTMFLYLDRERKPTFGRKDIQPVAVQSIDPGVIAVKTDSPFKSMKDLVDAAKANPEKVKTGDAGIGNTGYVLGVLQLERLAGVRFAVVHFDGGAPALTALQGGHVDATFTFTVDVWSQVKNGTLRVLGLTGKQENSFFPGVKTMESQGFNMRAFASVKLLSGPGGTPGGIVEILNGAVKKAMGSADYRKKVEEMGMTSDYMDVAATTTYWDETETAAREYMALVK